MYWSAIWMKLVQGSFDAGRTHVRVQFGVKARNSVIRSIVCQVDYLGSPSIFLTPSNASLLPPTKPVGPPTSASSRHSSVQTLGHLREDHSSCRVKNKQAFAFTD
jgi:hypothetical protein